MKKVASGRAFLDVAQILRIADLRPREVVADLGCGGGGYFTLQASRMVGENGVVYGIDVFKPALSALMSKTKLEGITNVIPVWSNVEVYQGAKLIKDRRLDVALLIQLLYQSKQHREIFRETGRMLKKGGRAVVIDWRTSQIPFGPKKEDCVSPERIVNVAQYEGFRLLKEFKASPYHFGLIFEKA